MQKCHKYGDDTDFSQNPSYHIVYPPKLTIQYYIKSDPIDNPDDRI